MKSTLSRVLLSLVLLVAATVTSGIVLVAVDTSPALAVGGYDNGAIADTALRYVGQYGGAACVDAGRSGYTGGTPLGSGDNNDGECRAFINCIVWMASGHTQWLGGGSDYFAAYLREGGQEITDVNKLAKGDIIQIGQGTHTTIIVSRISGNTFDVVDSNHGYDHKVMHYHRTVVLDGTSRAFRMGTVAGTSTGGGGGTTAIHVTDTVNIRPGPSTGSGAPLGTIPPGVSPTYHCWAQGENVSGVDVWFDVTYNGVSGYYASYYDDSSYSSDSQITSKYGVPACSGGGGGSGTGAIHVTDDVNIRPGPSTSSGAPLGVIPNGVSPTFHCWARGENISGVDVWFNISYNGINGYYASYYDDSSYTSDDQITSKYGIAPCGPTTTSTVHPAVAVTPGSGDESTIFQGTGTGFTPDSTVTARVIQPDGNEYSASYTKSKPVDAAGNFSWSWVWDPGDQDGTYTYVATDTSGASVRTTFTIAAPPPRTKAPILGFDAASAPTFATMQAWLTSPMRAIGVYIPVAAGTDDRFDKHQVNLTSDWVSQVRSLGWSILPIYFGQQAPESCFPADYWHMATDAATATTQGSAAADGAVAGLNSLGIQAGAPVYYDMEAYNAGCKAAVMGFLNGWTTRLHQLGYVAGVYGSRSSTMTDLSSMVGTSGFTAPDAVWVATYNGSNSVQGLGTPPDGLWTSHQRLNQYKNTHNETWGGVTISIDSDAVDAPAVSGPPSDALPPDITNTTAPAVTGTRRVGSVLSVDPGAWSTTPTSYSFQWLASGSPIAGATGQTYRPTAADLGRQLSVEVTASKTGYNSGSAIASADGLVGAGSMACAHAPSLSGPAKVGHVLRASNLGCTSPSGVTYRYQWQRSGRPINNATHSTYTLTNADRGKRIAVRVTAVAPGYTSVAKVSAVKVVSS